MLFLAAMILAAEPILVVNGQVIGLKVAGTWRTPEKEAHRRYPKLAFYAFGLGTVKATSHAYSIEREGEDGAFDLKIDGPPVGPMLGGVKPKAPRPVRTLPASSVYEAACRRFLATRGIRVAKAHVTRVLKVDLDGNGTDEVLIEATAGEIARQAEKASYSLVLLRALRAGRVVETPLDFYPTSPGGTMLTTVTCGVADLDGDGRMEVVVADTGIDENGAVLWGYRAGRATKLLENGSGV